MRSFYKDFELDEKSIRLINDFKVNVENALKEKDIFRGFGTTKNGQEIITAKESIKLHNDGISEQEIKAWVHFKQICGSPMTCWDDYYLPKGKSGYKIVHSHNFDSNLAVQINKLDGTFFKHCVPNTTLGLLVSENEEFGEIHFFDFETLNVYKIQSKFVVYREPYRTFNEDDLKELVEDGVLFFYENILLPLPVLLSQDTSRLEQYFQSNQELITSKFGKVVYKNHIDILHEKKPNRLSFANANPDERPKLSVISEEAQDVNFFTIKDCKFDSKWNEVSNKEDVSLFDGFKNWLYRNYRELDAKDLPNDTAPIHWVNFIDKYVLKTGKVQNPFKKDEQRYKKALATGITVCKMLFDQFLHEGITLDDQKKLDIIWNNRFNSFVSIDYNKIPIAIEYNKRFKSGTMQLRPIQRLAIGFSQINRSSMFALDVGLGKTISSIMSVNASICNGDTLRPIFIVPNSTYENWKKELGFNDGINGIFTNTSIKFLPLENLGAQLDKETKKIIQKPKFIEPKTISLLKKSGFPYLGVSNDYFANITPELTSIIKSEIIRPHKRIERSVEEVRTYFNFRETNSGTKTPKVDFDKLGFDYFVYDEFHNYKKCFKDISISIWTQIKGIRNKAEVSQSVLGAHALMINLINQYHGNKVLTLSATPFTNDASEIFVMLQNINSNGLKLRNIYNYYNFTDTFFNFNYDYVITKSGDVQYDICMLGFNNIKALQSILFDKILYRTGEEVGIQRPIKVNFPLKYYFNEYGESVELPKDKQVLPYLDMTQQQIDNQTIINNRLRYASFEECGKLMSDSLKNAFSPFYYKGEIPSDSTEFVKNSPKIDFTCRCIKNIKEYHDNRKEPCSGIVIYSNFGKVYFPLIKDYLIKNAKFKKDEVAIITSDETLEDIDNNEEIMEGFNNGSIKVIIATSVIKEGVNLQERATCLFDLYPEWNITDVLQLEGRIWRFGNKNQYVRIVLPLVKESMDMFVFQKLQEKARRINSIWNTSQRGNVIKEESINPEEIKYALVKDPKIIFAIKFASLISEAKSEVNKYNAQLEIIKEVKDAKDNIIKLKPLLKQTCDSAILEKENNYPYLKKRMSKKDLDVFKRNDPKKYDEIVLNCKLYDSYKNELSKFAQLSLKKITSLVPEIYDWAYNTTYYHVKDQWERAYKIVIKYEDKYLKPINETIDSHDFDKEYQEIDTKLKEAIKHLDYLNSDEFKKEKLEEITIEIDKRNMYNGDLSQIAKRFSNLNYLMSYQYNKDVPINAPLPKKEGEKIEVKERKSKTKDKKYSSLIINFINIFCEA